MSTPNEISTEKLLSLLYYKDRTILDLRSVSAYNGWREREESRKGHIKKARSFPFVWFNDCSWPEILKSKGAGKNHRIVVYGYNRSEIDEAAGLLRERGFSRVQAYYHFIDEWCEEAGNPMEYPLRYRQLVSVDWLNQLIEKSKAPEFDKKEYVLCHCHYQDRNSYLNGHIPGAIELNTNLLESPDTWNRRSPVELQDTLEKMGIRFDKTVLLYGGEGIGQMGAFRCALIMLYAGVEDVRIVDGGLMRWKKSHNVSNKVNHPTPVDDFGKAVPANPQYMISQKEAREYLSSHSRNLISIRSWPEYTGAVSGYSYIDRRGRIPGAVFSNCGTDAYHMENYRNPDHTCREYGAIKQMWCQLGIFRDKTQAYYCGSGWRASEAWFNAYLMGWDNISVYDGGWYEWSLDRNNPVESGIPVDELHFDR